jgi:hypothetical protein
VIEEICRKWKFGKSEEAGGTAVLLLPWELASDLLFFFFGLGHDQEVSILPEPLLLSMQGFFFCIG